MNKEVKTNQLFKEIPDLLKEDFNKTTYPWEILPNIKEIINRIVNGELKGYKLYKDGIWIGENVKIAKTATIIKPAVIGNNVEIRPNAYIRGCVIISDNCVIGNASELKNCILLEGVQVPHYNYVGDSILGYHSHMGAGAICSNLKSDKSNVVVHGAKDYQTGLRKFGAMIGEYADIGCGSVLNPGTVIGLNTRVYPLTSLRGVYPADCIVKSTFKTVKKK